jgi:hypothetical protein
MKRHYVLVGGLCGLAWAAALRAWMVQLAGAESRFSWMTLVLVLAPGTAVGALLGLAAYLRVNRLPQPRRLIFAPVLFAGALLDPSIFRALIRNGQGSGALMVVAAALGTGFVLSRRGFSVARLAAALVTLPILLLLGLMGSMAGPIQTPRGLWVSLFGLSLILLLGLASVLPHPPAGRPAPGARSWALLGALAGLAWSGALRGFMTAVAGSESEVHWVNTFGFILVPGVLAGALLGWAEHLRRTGGRPRWRLLTLAPLLFVAVLLSNPLDFGSVLEDGVGGGAIGVPIIGILGGFAICGRGPVVWRSVSGVVFVAGLAVWALTAVDVGGPAFALTSTHGLWATVLYWTLLATLAVGSSVPLRSLATEDRHDPITARRRAAPVR